MKTVFTKSLFAFFSFSLMLCSEVILAQSITALQAQKCLGGSYSDEATSIQQTKDGGYIVAGLSYSNDDDVSGNHGYLDYWIVKLNASGSIQWQKSLGGSGYDYAQSIQQTKDGGYVVAGFSDSNDGDVSGNHGNSDYWLVKLNASGSIQWQKCLGGSLNDYAYSIQQTKDGGYIVAGYSESDDGNVNGNHGLDDYWIVKLTALGSIQWQKSLGGTLYDHAQSIQQTKDGGYIVAGNSQSDDGDVSNNHNHGVDYHVDYWVVKLDSGGSIKWQKCFGGSFTDEAESIQQTKDGGYIVAGYSSSNDGDVSGNHGGADYWIVKLDAGGNIQWQKSLGGTSSEYAQSIQQTNDGGYIVAGYTFSNDGDVSGNHGDFDYWIVKVNSTGSILWQKSLGGTADDEAQSIQQTNDRGYVVAGYSKSNDGNVSGNHGNGDYWIVKLSASGNLVEQQPLLTAANKEQNIKTSKLRITPNPVHSILHIEGLNAVNSERPACPAGRLTVTSESGSVVLATSIKNISSYNLDVSKLTAGVYYLQAGEESVRFVKE